MLNLDHLLQDNMEDSWFWDFELYGVYLVTYTKMFGFVLDQVKS